jgi:hypothetical protein
MIAPSAPMQSFGSLFQILRFGRCYAVEDIINQHPPKRPLRGDAVLDPFDCFLAIVQRVLLDHPALLSDFVEQLNLRQILWRQICECGISRHALKRICALEYSVAMLGALTTSTLPVILLGHISYDR